MVDNQHQKITGYRDLDLGTINLVNLVKDNETVTALLWKRIRGAGEFEPDPRWLAIARTHFEEGHSALVRALTKPVSPFDE